jgi:hypothetical protein
MKKGSDEAFNASSPLSIAASLYCYKTIRVQTLIGDDNLILNLSDFVFCLIPNITDSEPV